jgi:prepilin-type processing-associated H-X9-DG protein/prepilin-type N-terminal cleavage/methylation domain-containing protein
MRYRNGGCRRHRGFTIVELLVVVGILLLLIGILLPVLAGARRQARELKCVTNLRTLGQAMTHYARMSDGYYPGCYVTITGYTSKVVWAPRLRACMSGSRDAFLCPERDPERFAWSDRPQGSTGVAPAAMVGYGYTLGERMLGFQTPFSYGYNWIGGGRLRALGANVNGSTNSDPPQKEVRVTHTKFPSEMIALCDSDGDGSGDAAIAPYLDNDGPPGTIHRGGANVLFCDGHVRWYDRKEITVPASNDPSVGTQNPPWRDVGPMWRNDHGWW